MWRAHQISIICKNIINLKQIYGGKQYYIKDFFLQICSWDNRSIDFYRIVQNNPDPEKIISNSGTPNLKWI